MPATLHDIATIVSHRRSMFAAMGYSDEAALDAMSSAFEPWLRRTMLAGEYLAWFAITDDQAVAAGLGLWLMDWPPHMIGSGARRDAAPDRFQACHVVDEVPARSGHALLLAEAKIRMQQQRRAGVFEHAAIAGV